jgi:hypothetical protein
VFKSKYGYSIYAPLSRQEKGVDLILAKREGVHCSTVSLQVKASRTYSPKPAKKKNIRRFTYTTWFNRFVVPDEADFFTLVGIYPPEENRTNSKNIHSWWSAIILLFTIEEMKEFINNVKTKKGTPDKMFGFGFHNPKQIFQTRGIESGEQKEVSHHLIENRLNDIKSLLDDRLQKLKG